MQTPLKLQVLLQPRVIVVIRVIIIVHIMSEDEEGDETIWNIVLTAEIIHYGKFETPKSKWRSSSPKRNNSLF